MLSSETTDVIPSLHGKFDDCGRRWAEKMLARLRASFLDEPLIWPGTREQALTIVHALAEESLGEFERAALAEIVQSGARAAWRDLVRV
jgi:hypothetical protein